MPKYAVIKPSRQINFTPWVVVSEDPDYTTKHKEIRMFAWYKSEDGLEIEAIIDRKMRRDGYDQWILFTNSQENLENDGTLKEVRDWIMENIKSKYPKTLFKKHRTDIMWEGYQWK